MQLFFYPNLSSTYITLPEEESKHCIKVLRKKIGNELILIDGKGLEAITEIVDDNAKKCVLKTKIINKKYKSKKYSLHIIISPTKNFDKMEWMIEKCVEIGIDEITFIETKNSERNKVNFERCEKIAISSIKQSKQYWLPKINGITKYDEAIKSTAAENEIRLIAWCEAETVLTINKYIDIENDANKQITILIGPEGDFTPHEINIAKQAHFIPISLGKNILRTETAAVYVATAVSVLHNQ